MLKHSSGKKKPRNSIKFVEKYSSGKKTTNLRNNKDVNTSVIKANKKYMQDDEDIDMKKSSPIIQID